MPFDHKAAFKAMMTGLSADSECPEVLQCLDIFTGELEALAYLGKQLPPECMLICLKISLHSNNDHLQKTLAALLKKHYNKAKKLQPLFEECLRNIRDLRFSAKFYADNFPEFDKDRRKALHYETAALIEQNLYDLVGVLTRNLEEITVAYAKKPLPIPRRRSVSDPVPMKRKSPKTDHRPVVPPDPSHSPSVKQGIPLLKQNVEAQHSKHTSVATTKDSILPPTRIEISMFQTTSGMEKIPPCTRQVTFSLEPATTYA